jgi:hypothetical protein
MTKNSFHTTGVSNIDNKEYGLNILCNGSIGYLTFDDIETAHACNEDLQKLINNITMLQHKYNIIINLSFEN